MKIIPKPIELFLKRFERAQIFIRAAALAYHSLLALIPIFGLLFWYLKSIGVTESWAGMVKTFLLSHLNVNSSALVVKHFDKLTTSASAQGAGVVGLGVLLYTTWNLIIKFSDSLDHILGTAHEEVRLDRKFAVVVIRRAMVLTAIPLTTMFSLVVSSWVRHQSVLEKLFSIPHVGAWLALPIAWFANFTTMTLVYYLVPKAHVSFFQAARAALIVAPVFEVVKYAVGQYNAHAISVQKLYGALSAIPLLMIWIQVAWMILLAGALFIQMPRSNTQNPAL
jgi:membrane protein